jgi:signal transduction histidine kinase
MIATMATDNGNSLDAGAIDKIFYSFFTTRLEPGGLGLGLTIVHNLVTARLLLN